MIKGAQSQQLDLKRKLLFRRAGRHHATAARAGWRLGLVTRDAGRKLQLFGTSRADGGS